MKQRMAQKEATLEYWKETILSQLQVCRNTKPVNGLFHHNVVFISPPMLTKKDGVQFYRTLIEWIKKEAKSDSKRPFEVKERWEIIAPNGEMAYSESTTKTGILSDAYILDMPVWKGEEQFVIAQVDLQLYPKFKYTTEIGAEVELLKGRVSELEKIIKRHEELLAKLTKK